MKRSVIVIAALSLTVACAPTDQTSAGFGDSVRQNIAAQVINPDPYPVDAAAPEYDGERTRDALQRYREDKVKRPVSQTTTTIKQGGSK